MNTGSYTSLLVSFVFSEMCVVTLHPVAAAYKYSCRWWEALVMLRKLFLKIVAIFVVNPILKGVCSIWVVVWQSESHVLSPNHCCCLCHHLAATLGFFILTGAAGLQLHFRPYGASLSPSNLPPFWLHLDSC